MRRSIGHSLMVLVLAAIVAVPAVVRAEPKAEMHRVGAKADDGSGWHLAVSTNGSFSVLLPIPFNDFTIHDAAKGETSYVVGGKSSEGIKFVALELPLGGKAPPDLASIPKSLAANPANKVSDVSRSRKGDADILSLTVADNTKTLYMRCIQMTGARYTLTIEFPDTYRDLVAASKDRYFDSFKLKPKS